MIPCAPLSRLTSHQGSHARVQGHCAPPRVSKLQVHGKDRKHHPADKAQLLAPRCLGRIRAPSFRRSCHQKIPLDSRHCPTAPYNACSKSSKLHLPTTTPTRGSLDPLASRCKKDSTHQTIPNLHDLNHWWFRKPMDFPSDAFSEDLHKQWPKPPTMSKPMPLRQSETATACVVGWPFSKAAPFEYNGPKNLWSKEVF